jgi:predicted nucleic acid-binding protein
VLLDAAALRAKFRFRTPDAILLATGIGFSATAAVTNDKTWKEAQTAGFR